MIRRAVAAMVAVVALAVSGLVGTAPAVGAASTSDTQLARAGVLVPSDFPAGWTEGPRSEGSDRDLDAAAAKVESCKPFLAFGRANRKNPRAKSKAFELQGAHVTNTVSVYASIKKAKVAMGTFADPSLPGCLERLFRDEFRRQLEQRPGTAEHVTSIDVSIETVPGVKLGDDAVAYQGPVVVALDDGTSQTINLGVATVRVARVLAGYSWTSDADISATLQPAIVRSVTRLQDAQSSA